ncbi:MAG: hypothetical protein ACRDLE_05380 [Gaiellaceae bacterium]
MRLSLLPTELRAVERELRIVAILHAADQIGLTPLPVEPLHAIAYFADALAPVWNIPIIDGRILKRHRPYYPALQNDLDRLVGKGVVTAQHVRYTQVEGDTWRLEGSYALYRPFADPILTCATEMREQARELTFVQEVVFATSGLGVSGVSEASDVDATYADPLIDVGDMIDVAPDEEPNPTAQVALRFGALLPDLSTAEMTNLYVRQLYSRMQVA